MVSENPIEMFLFRDGDDGHPKTRFYVSATRRLLNPGKTSLVCDFTSALEDLGRISDEVIGSTGKTSIEVRAMLDGILAGTRY